MNDVINKRFRADQHEAGFHARVVLMLATVVIRELYGVSVLLMQFGFGPVGMEKSATSGINILATILVWLVTMSF